MGVFSTDIKNKAFDYWYSLRSDTDVANKLKQEGYVVTRQTIASWRLKYDWITRADKIDSKKQQARDESISFEESLLLDLQKQKERYDVYFDSLESGKVDNQAMYVYNQLCEKLISLKNKINPKDKRKVTGLDNVNVEELKRQILGI